ncbi:MAG: hypothetical protein RL541_1296 [Pseudomonadota bacterium]
MDAAAHNPAFAQQAGVPQSVAQDFSQSSKGMKFGKDRSVATRPDRQSINKPKTNQGKQELFKKGGEMKESKAMAKKEISFMEKKGAPKSMVKHEKEEYGMKKGGMKKMATGGITTAKMGAVKTAAPSKDGVASKGKTKGTMVKMSGSKPLGMKKGGKAYC